MRANQPNQPNKSEFEKTGPKGEGATRGYVAKRGGETYLIKHSKNRGLTEAERKEELRKLGENLYETRMRELENVISIRWVRRCAASFLAFVARRNVSLSDMRFGDLIREDVSAGIYIRLLGDYAPEVFLVKYDKNGGEIFLASKFLGDENRKFTTVSEHITNGTDDQYQSAIGIERILAAEILLGESDVPQLGNIGTIPDESGVLHFAKIDHGKSLCYSEYHTLGMALFLACIKSKGIKINKAKLEEELDRQINILRNNQGEIETGIKKRVAELEAQLDKGLKITIRSIGGYNIFRPFSYKKFTYDAGKNCFVTNKGETLADHFISEFRLCKSRSNVLHQSMRDAKLCIPFILAFSLCTFVGKYFEDQLQQKLGYEAQKVLLGVSALALTISVGLFICFVTAHACLAHQFSSAPSTHVGQPEVSPSGQSACLSQ